METYRVDSFVLSGVITDAAQRATGTHGLMVGGREFYHLRDDAQLRKFRQLLAESPDKFIVRIVGEMMKTGSGLVSHQGDETIVRIDADPKAFVEVMAFYAVAASNEEEGDHLLAQRHRRPAAPARVS